MPSTPRIGRVSTPRRFASSDPATGALRSLYARWTAFTIPRSPTGSTSGRCRRKIRNISAVHRPIPFTCVSFSTTDSSSSRSRTSSGSRPPRCVCTGRGGSAVFCPLRPTPRSRSSGTASTCDGVGRPRRALRNAEKIVAAAFVDSCWPTMARMSALNGFACWRAARPHGPCARIRSRRTGSRREQPPCFRVIDRHHFRIDVSVTCARISISPAWIGGAACAAAAASRNSGLGGGELTPCSSIRSTRSTESPAPAAAAVARARASATASRSASRSTRSRSFRSKRMLSTDGRAGGDDDVEQLADPVDVVDPDVDAVARARSLSARGDCCCSPNPAAGRRPSS
mgnify:CR=1 FL=1